MPMRTGREHDPTLRPRLHVEVFALDASARIRLIRLRIAVNVASGRCDAVARREALQQ
jgi:hypothetical protein